MTSIPSTATSGPTSAAARRLPAVVPSTGPVDEDRVTGFIPPFERDDRVYQGTAGEGVAVDADGNVYAAEGPNSLTQAGGAFTKYSDGRQ